ncbi:MAG: hypothetical protein HYR66_03430 [Sphingobacteriales bacterium]|nr:hypothetical protein [Sphingobacteriales bacterium]MBI3718919.1 hypothetical protein [Sphingobacteriales bacterium]
MKNKVLLVFIVLIAALAVSVYFIPPVKTSGYKVLVTCNNAATMRIIVNENNWQKWWPGKKTGQSQYIYQGFTYRIDKVLLNGFDATIFNGVDSAKANLQIEPVSMDSSNFTWTYAGILPANPVKKLLYYINGSPFAGNIKSLTSEMKAHFDQQENVYGMKISRDKVKDSTLVSLKNTFDHYPTTEEVYGMITASKEYIAKNGGKQTDLPMLNVNQTGINSYETMIGIPTAVPVPPNDKFITKRMVLGFILTSEIKGGVAAVKDAEQQMNNYVLDHQKLSPAIPFQQLVTDRMQEKDTTKWITRLYFPVFY